MSSGKGVNFPVEQIHFLETRGDGVDASNLQVSKSSVNKPIKEAKGNIPGFQMSEIDNKRDESVLNSCNSHKKIKNFHIPHLPIKVEGGAMGTDENKVK